eukprot:4383378-Ditylum_brightwellii.AAC.1
MRQKIPSRESKSCDGGIKCWLSQTDHSASCSTHGEGDNSCNAGIQNWLSQTAHSASHLTHWE